MRKNTISKLVMLAALVMLISPAVSYAFGGKADRDGKRGDAGHQRPIPPIIAQQYDADGDGQLSDEEREAAHAAILKEFDVDGDGELSRQERRAVGDAARDAFTAKYDTDGDGEISAEERDAVKADFIERHDSNGDGLLSKDEIPDRGFGGRRGPCRK